MSNQPVKDASRREGGRERAPQSFGGQLLAAINYVGWVLRAPFAIAVISFVIFFFPDQIREIYRALAAEFVEGSYLKAVLAVLGVSLLSLFLRFLCRALWVVSTESEKYVPNAADRSVYFVWSLIITLLPLAGVILSIVQIRGYEFADILRWSKQFEGLPQDLEVDFGSIIENVDAVKRLLTFSLIVLVVIALALVALSFLRREPGRSTFYRAPYGPLKLLAAISVTAALIVLAALQPYVNENGSLIITRGFMNIGSLFIISMFLILLAYFFGAGSRLYDRRGFPILTVMLGLGVVFSYFNVNDNHKVQFEPTKSAHHVDVLTRRFVNWFEALPASRKQLYASRGAKYPVYLVSAQGGGLYAANLTAITLARLYSLCPALKYHVFAISGVSGGSLGASLFTALWTAQSAGAPDPAPPETLTCQTAGPADTALEQQISAYLAEDFLAPLTAGLLFPDFLQRFIYPPIGVLDRARSFEAGLQEAWRATSSDSPNPFTDRFLDYSSQINGAPLWAPTLMLHSTHVETGRRFLVTPALFSKDDVITSLYSLNPTSVRAAKTAGQGFTISRDISLATAVSLSSRFPLVLPPGVYRRPAQARRFVDGGYFENSGIETAIDVKTSIEERLKTPTIYRRVANVQSLGPKLAGGADTAGGGATVEIEPEFRIIVLSENYVLDEELEGLNEIGAPLRTLNRTRLRRGELAKARADKAFTKRYVIELQHSNFPMPLGWQLSRHTQATIKAQIGLPSGCETHHRLRLRDEKLLEGVQEGGGAGLFVRLAGRLISNRCTLRDIIEELPPPAAANSAVSGAAEQPVSGGDAAGANSAQ